MTIFWGWGFLIYEIFISLYYLKYKLLIYYSNLNKLSALFY